MVTTTYCSLYWTFRDSTSIDKQGCWY